MEISICERAKGYGFNVDANLMHWRLDPPLQVILARFLVESLDSVA